MNGDMWQFVAVVILFVVVLLAAYWFVFVPRRTPDELLDGERRKDPGEGLRAPTTLGRKLRPVSRRNPAPKLVGKRYPDKRYRDL